MRVIRALRIAALVGCVAGVVAVQPHAVREAAGQVPPAGCSGSVVEGPDDKRIQLGDVGPDGWVSEKAEVLGGPLAANRYLFTVKPPADGVPANPALTTHTVQVYVGDQWYNLNLSLSSVEDNREACWRVETKGTSATADRRVLQFVRPDERAIDVRSGQYMLTVRAGDAAGLDPSKPFTVRVAVTPKACALNPPDLEEESMGLRIKQKSPEAIEKKFQVGISIEPNEPTQFSFMTFNAYVSPPYTDLFDFEWELDGEKVAGVVEPTLQKPFSELKKTPDGKHTVKLTARGAREYKDPTEARFNFTPFEGGSVSVTCTFPQTP